jgi:glycosyltransferase involved in cell wall biosynthesis
MISPAVSVIIPCFNHGEFLPEAVASVAALKRGDVEIIVVDDGSTDERTREEIDALISRGIKVVRQENGGPGPARNAGILVSQGKYILPLDADNRLRSDYIEHGIRVLAGNPQVGVVYGDAECFGVRAGQWHMGAFDRDKLLQQNYIDACAIYRRTVWEQNSGYDSARIVQGFEDWDFWLGAMQHGWQFIYVPEILFDYRIAEESMITRAKPFEKQIEEFVAKKHGPLYRRAWLQLAGQRESLLQEINRQESLRWTFRNLVRLLKSRFKRKFQKSQMRLHRIKSGKGLMGNSELQV